MPSRFQKIIFILVFLTGLIIAKDFTDNLGNVYSTENKTEIGYTEFIQVHGESVLLMDDLNSSQSVTTVHNKDFMQLVDRKDGWCFVRAYDSDAGYVEGWVKDNKIRRKKNGELVIFYGKNLLLMEDIIEKRPVWVLSDSTALLTLPKAYANNIGVLFYNTKIFVQQEITEYFQVKVFDEYNQTYTDGWVLKKDVTEDKNKLSGAEEIVPQSVVTQNHASESVKTIEIKAKASEELPAPSASKEILVKTMKIKKHKENLADLNTLIDHNQKEIFNETNNITKSTISLENKLSQLSEQEKLVERIEKKQQLATGRQNQINTQKKLKSDLANYKNSLKKIKTEIKISNQQLSAEQKLSERFINRIADLNKELEQNERKVTQLVDKERKQKALQHQSAKLEYSNSGTVNSSSNDRILKKSTKRFGFKHSFDDNDDAKYVILNNWNRQQSYIDAMITDKQFIINNLYKIFKTQDNLLSGQFTLKFDLTPDGKTKKVRITDATWSNLRIGNKLNKEIEKKVRGWIFPPDNHTNPSQRRDRPVSIPYIF